ncbi:MAG: response regulator [Acidaminococcaceae bacterium]|nr:response regulator [Acidaminococcaceae bacterium]
MSEYKILIADDEALLRLDLREMLTEGGHIVIGEAVDGEKAVALTRKLRPDLVIMDVRMPVMDGITAAEQIVAEQLAPVLLLTAYSQADVVDRAASAGVISYLVKPVREEQLFPTVEIAVARFRELHRMNEELLGLRDDLETRKLLDRAKGILMTSHKITEQEAYRRMQKYSMLKGVSMKKLAADIIAASER